MKRFCKMLLSPLQAPRMMLFSAQVGHGKVA